MAINRRIFSGILLSLTLVTSGVAATSEAEARRFDDLYYEKLALIKAKKLKKEKHHHFESKHHFEPRHHVKRKRFKKHRSFKRSHHKFGKSPFSKKFFLKK